MADRQPWECPRCHRILGPHVDEHDCDGDGGVLAGVGAAPSGPPPAMATVSPPHTVHVHVTGSVLSDRNLADAVRQEVRRYTTRNPGVWRG